MGGDAREVWASGTEYEPYIGRWSRLVAAEFVDWLAVEPRRRWLEIGCGTGALTASILGRAEPATVVAIDPSAEYVRWAGERIKDPRAEFEVADALDLPRGPFDVVVSGLVLNFLPAPAAAIVRMREAGSEGLIAAYVWDYAERMELIRHFWDAAVDLDPTAGTLDEGVRFPLCRPDRLAALWRSAGLDDVATRAIDVDTVFASFDDYWEPFLGGQGPAPTYAMSLDEGRRAALREAIRGRLPLEADGSIRLVARAWAVRGVSG